MSENDITIGTKSFDLSEGLFNKEIALPDPPADEFKSFSITDYKDQFKTNPVLFWGKKNNYHLLLDEQMRKCDTLEAGLTVQADHLIGQGLYIYKEDFTGTATERIIPLDIPEVNDRFSEINADIYIDTFSREFTRWGNAYPCFFLSDRDRKIKQLRIYDTADCRVEKPNPNTGKIENIWVSRQWGNPNMLLTSNKLTADQKKYFKKIKLLDEYYRVDQIKMGVANGIYTFAYHIKQHTSGKVYGRMPWHAAYENGWIGISISVPKMKERLFRHSMTLNYIIKIHEDYWITRYGDDWTEKFTPEDRQKLKKEFQTEIEQNLMGEENAFKTLFCSMKDDGNGNTQYSLEIELIDNKLKEGTYIPDTQMSDAHIISALMLDPSMIGYVVPGGKQSAGSGSNIREASLALTARLRPYRVKMLQPLYDFCQYDGLFEKYGPFKIGIKDFIINTLDQRAPIAGQEVAIH